MVKKINSPDNKNILSCAREVMNYSSISSTDRFDKPNFNGDKFLEKLPIHSPKLISLLKNIHNLDKRDYTEDRKLYKHFIFSDIKKGYGAKIIASAMMAAGYKLVMKNEKNKIILDQAEINNKNESKFAILSSTAVWNTAMNPNNSKKILETFNDRPGNIYGDKVRFIILDSGFKEGVDLFDVRYAHIFEEQMTDADLIQAVGRGTRFCGQKGLTFENNKGWVLGTFIYKLYKTTPSDILKLKFFKGKEPILDDIKKLNKNLYSRIKFTEEISNVIKDVSVDKLLNDSINKKNDKYKKYYDIAKIIIPVAGIFTVGAGIMAIKKKYFKK